MTLWRTALLLLTGGCAVIAPPPGGPPDASGPVLVRVTPDSGASLPGFNGAVSFEFNEVVNEGTPNIGLGTGALEKLVVLSPTENVPSVRWQRRRVSVRPREGWRANTVYHIELLPGITDLRNNRGTARRVIAFTTGGDAPTVTIRGHAYDWTTAQPLRGSLVEAFLVSDSLRYRATTDSSGAFSIGPLRPSVYLVTAVNDLNRNLKRDPREQFDSVRVGPDSLDAGELWTFPHDTAGPRLQTVARADSDAATLTFSQPLDPTQRWDTSLVRVRKLPDSSAVPVKALLASAAYDSVRGAQAAAAGAARADSLRRARPDSAAAPPGADKPPLPDAGPGRRPEIGVPPGAPGAPGSPAGAPTLSRKALPTKLVVVAAQKWDSAGRYVIELTGIRNVNKVAGNTRNVLAVDPTPPGGPLRRPRPGAADSTRGATADSTRAAPADSTSRAPAAPPRPPAPGASPRP